ncbi:hypothetical protein J2750_000203 [Methanococcoides alaskense]|uniref:Uncharacterized protein n=1 Tax=Methanococcoides alaskense TaxID=325778 RepID=A0AA90TXQ9_9EURY|nr:hypothetical protein [Methanococcoides alaskense]
MNDMFGEVVFSYTSKQAVEDGILFDILQVNPEWEKGIFRYITTNLMATCRLMISISQTC